MELKKNDTLFHTTKTIDILKSILNFGFASSYADERSILGNIKILMTSFSNIPLIEAKTQVTYGDYSIGLTKEWAIKSRLQPVAYTYSSSVIEQDINHLFKEAAIGQVLKEIKEFSNDDFPIAFKGETLEIIRDLYSQNLPDKTLLTLKKLFESTFNRVHNILLFLKHIEVLDNNDNIRIAYNDREWRYIPSNSENTIKQLILDKDASGNINPEFIEYSSKSKSKPHFITNNLLFNLEDLKFVIVKEKREVREIYDVLYDKYTKIKVEEAIFSGNLTILALDEVWHNL